ncbi:MAG: aminotransferase class I/II-fold pyridoxal phosphate-dependent enzyme [Flavobacteriales bacterium]|nr:aminotransferase class I/II-fold pyridoxal phosphate-dependent enzyme [Flavobacteriales bacterium]MCB9175376.1 aminotransferase class I/II-fold pyridoxal phosphate-dependent enzyme [Flavobacteriales bacterium]
MKTKNFETQAIRTQSERSQFNEHSTPLHLTSSFVFDDAEQMRAMFSDELEGNIYSRFSNPNTTELIDKICLLEGAEAGWATATGMAAVFTSLAALLNQGDHVLACRSIFGSSHAVLTKLLPKWGITHTYVDVDDTQNWQNHITEKTKIVFIETPTNPGVDILDLEWLGKFCKKNNVLLLVDNCFATPYLQQPIKFGAHLVIHSATKYIDGQGRVLGGLIAGDKNLINEIKAFARHSGPAMSPFNAWVLSKSLETLAVRMDRHAENALKLAQCLEKHPQVEWVKYPFLPSHPQHAVAKKQMKSGGGIVSFSVKGGLEKGRNFLNKLQMISMSANLGDTRSIATHPASTTHGKLTEQERLESGILPGLIRVSVGLEHIDDIIKDVEQALA